MQLQKNYLYSRLSRGLSDNHFFLINHTRKLFWYSNLNDSQRKNFALTLIQLSEVDIQPSSELFELLNQMSSLFIYVTNFKITITNLGSKPRTIVCKLLWFKDKQNILRKAKLLKGTNIFINEDYCLDTVEYRNELWE